MNVNLCAPLWKELLPEKSLNFYKSKINDGSATIADIPIEFITHFPLRAAACDKGLSFKLWSPQAQGNIDAGTQAFLNAGDWVHVVALDQRLPHKQLGSISCQINDNRLLIFGVFVKEAYRGRGIMKLLMGHALGLAARLAKPVELDDVSHCHPDFLSDIQTIQKVKDLISKFNTNFKSPYDFYGFEPKDGEHRCATFTQSRLKTLFKGIARSHSMDDLNKVLNPTKENNTYPI